MATKETPEKLTAEQIKAAIDCLDKEYSVGNYDGVTTPEETLGENYETVWIALTLAAAVLSDRENGFVSVPRTPTPQMLLEVMRILDGKKLHDSYDEMLTAAPQSAVDKLLKGE